MFWNKRINSEEYEKLNKKLVELEAELDRLEVNLALFKKQHHKKIKKILDDDDDDQQDPYDKMLLPTTFK
jgi:hypothetical protein